jgi:hypothetical protein
MKKIILSALAVLAFSFANAQESKAYLGVSVGVAFPGGSAAEGTDAGLNLGFINFGYRFSESWGATANLTSSGFPISDTDAAVGVGTFSVGPMYTTKIGENMSLDLKPQYALSMVGKLDGAGELDDATFKGNGFVLGSSLNFGISKGFKFSINLDYTTGKFKEVEIDGDTYDLDSENKFNSLAIGAGIRYNF